MREQGCEAWAKWKALVTEQGKSGQTVAAFCQQRDVLQWQFFAWKKGLRQAGERQFVELQVVESRTPAQRAAVHSRAIEIRLDSGRRVFVEPGFDGEHLRALLAALEMPA